MKIDIEKLNRKTPYPDPSEDFFKQVQANVLSQTVGNNPVAEKKEAKVFSLNVKWMAAAAVVLIGGLTAFFNFSNDPEVSVAQQSPIIDSVYKIEPVQEPASDLIAKNTISKDTQTEISEPKKVNAQSQAASFKSQDHISKSKSAVNNTDRQDYAYETKKKPEAEVEKVLAAFTPDQLKDLDRNSEQDVYLDLYN